MIDEPPSFNASDEADGQFQAGDRVRVIVGVLTGLVGVVIRPTSNHGYLLSLDGIDAGVHVTFKGIALERVSH